jgi:UDP-glucuronate 4-epimerase
MSQILVAGCAGFIGMHMVEKLLHEGHSVIGVDSLSPYYVQKLKEDRLLRIQQSKNFQFLQLDLTQPLALQEGAKKLEVEAVIHLAAQPGVRYSIDHPAACLNNNIVAFGHVLEFCRQRQTSHLVYASSSSVYGLNTLTPYATHHNVDHPVSLYAASKKSNELMAHCYSHLFRLPTTGLRFFTVYGPWGRPDMAPWIFSQAIMKGDPIRLFNHGNMSRDFTYVEDITEGIMSVLGCVATPSEKFSQEHPVSDISSAPYRIFNIGNRQPVQLLDFVHTLENALGLKANIIFEPLQPGDVLNTMADTDSLYQATGFQPTTSLEEGLKEWAAWFLSKGQHYPWHA